MAEDTQGHLQKEEYPCSGVRRTLSWTHIQENDISHSKRRKGVSDVSISVLTLTQKLLFPTIPKT